MWKNEVLLKFHFISKSRFFKNLTQVITDLLLKIVYLAKILILFQWIYKINAIPVKIVAFLKFGIANRFKWICESRLAKQSWRTTNLGNLFYQLENNYGKYLEINKTWYGERIEKVKNGIENRNRPIWILPFEMSQPWHCY